MSMSGGGLGSTKIAYMTVNPTGTSTLLPGSGGRMIKCLNLSMTCQKKYDFNIRASLRLSLSGDLRVGCFCHGVGGLSSESSESFRTELHGCE